MAECLFCRIASGETKGDLVYQDGAIVAFKDIRPLAPVHLLIVPKKHITTLLDLQQEDRMLLGDIFLVANRLARDYGLAEQGFRVVVNCGAAAGQSVFHIHFHLMGGRPMAWPPG